ncbi:MAG: LLM class flavin-dependent oxidoreductase [Pseudomonadota bacterium]
MNDKPALSLAAVPGRRRKTLEMAQEIEARGYAGIYCPSLGDCMSLCAGIAQATSTIRFGTSVAPIYFRLVEDYAASAAFIHEISEGRFDFGIGVSHDRVLRQRDVRVGKPLADIRAFVARLREVPRVGELPPIVLAALRERMIKLATEISDGLVLANAAMSHIPRALQGAAAAAGPNAFFIGNMIPTCVHDKVEVAREVNRKTLTSYAYLPNYRNYWRQAGYGEEMDAVEQFLADGKPEAVGACLSDRWIDDVTIAGPASLVKERVANWREAGVKTPILVPSSANGGQLVAFDELFAVFD